MYCPLLQETWHDLVPLASLRSGLYLLLGNARAEGDGHLRQISWKSADATKKEEGINGHMYYGLGVVAIFHGQDLLADEKKAVRYARNGNFSLPPPPRRSFKDRYCKKNRNDRERQRIAILLWMIRLFHESWQRKSIDFNVELRSAQKHLSILPWTF